MFVGFIAARRVASHAGGCSFGFTVVFVAVGAGGRRSPVSMGAESSLLWGVETLLNPALCSAVLIVL